MREGQDIGLDRNIHNNRQRTINPDGSFNIKKVTGKIIGNVNPYHWIITISWTKYWIVILSFYIGMNISFATFYYFIGIEQLSGLIGDTIFVQWLNCFFFSVQCFTTVGFGGIHPIGVSANFVAAFESFAGLMTFAISTGSLYGRFSRPISRIKYSENILIAPYKEGTGMQFIVASELSSALMEMEATVNVSWNDTNDKGLPIRKFQQVKLEIDKIAMFPMSWVINHPIDEESVLYNRSIEEIKAIRLEVFILLKGFDDVFSQIIYNRHEFVAEDFVWGAKFSKPFYVDESGKIILDLSKVGAYEFVQMSK